MTTQIITPEHKKAGALFIAIFALAAMLFFSSCSAQRNGCAMSRGFSGYGATR